MLAFLAACDSSAYRFEPKLLNTNKGVTPTVGIDSHTTATR